MKLRWMFWFLLLSLAVGYATACLTFLSQVRNCPLHLGE